MESLQFFTRLFKKYLDNCCSPEEIDYLMELMRSEEYKLLAGNIIEGRLQEKRDLEISDDGLRKRLDTRLQFILKKTEAPSVRKLAPSYLWRWVAAASIIIVASAILFRNIEKGESRNSDMVAVTSGQPLFQAVVTRYLRLPDGTTVLLHAGSELEFPASFTGKNREVRLSGEAYFDVAHNSKKPFIIYTGNVKTTVLGTAFNIRADEKQVTVSVTRGKVKVEAGSKVLAVLTPDQQIKYNVPNALIEKVTVNAYSIVTGWASENMLFNGITFKEIADVLSKRYGVAITFKNEALKNCKIRASFSGTETLEQVASVLSATKNGNFQQFADGSIVFDGEGCN